MLAVPLPFLLARLLSTATCVCQQSRQFGASAEQLFCLKVLCEFFQNATHCGLNSPSCQL
jgi:hypothetical protein